MKTVTQEYIDTLQKLLDSKLDRIAQIERMLGEIRARYSKMTNSQLHEAIRDVRGMQKELEAENAWCEKTRKEIREFYKPAMVI